MNSFGIDKRTYIFYVIKELLTFQTFSFSLHSEEGTVKYENVWFFVVCNKPYFGGGMEISPKAKPKNKRSS
ncbi:hypothetical protein [Psychrobacillus insolitus]|uniref:hypothetical protein n=1 Tax=Psychrobacillus insolitus TaxID=1461 RepID=UPI000DAC5D00